MNAQTHAMIFRGAVGVVTTVRVKVIKSTEMDRHRNLFAAKCFSSNVQAPAPTAVAGARPSEKSEPHDDATRVTRSKPNQNIL